MCVNFSCPRFIYMDTTQVQAVGEPEKNLLGWWRSVKDKFPFNQLVADRGTACDNMFLRVKLQHINEGCKISALFKENQIECEGVPAENYIGALFRDGKKIYQIGNSSYQILETISTSGSYGDVFLALDTNTKHEVTIKILRYKEDREAQMHKKMSDMGGHPNIVTYIGSGVILDRTWIVMENIKGPSLREYKEQNEWNDELKEQLDSALSFMQRAGVTSERENDNENIMVVWVDGRPQLKLIDFGTLAAK